MARQDRGEAPEKVRQQRSPLNMKASPELRTRIEEAARASGLSLTQEVERRLIDSFGLEDQLGGQKTLAFFRSAAARIALVERLTGKSWLEDYATWTAAKQMIQHVVDDFAPLPPNFSAIYDAVMKQKAARDEAARLWREHIEKWPSGMRPPNALLALAPSDALARQLIPDVRLKPDGTERTEEEMAEMKADFEVVAEAQRRVEELGKELAKAEEEEAKAKASGMDIARQIIELTNRARKAD